MLSEHTLSSQTRNALADSYRSDNRPWVVAYSGGKDSTCVLQLVLEMLLELKLHHKPVHIISSDTLVEAPNIVNYVEKVLSSVSDFAKEHDLPLNTHIVRPSVEQTFWSKLIGRGYPPPTRWFRWCTSNMKIKPTRAAIDAITREHGSVILLLGSRSKESSSRSRSIASRSSNSRGLNPHHEIPNAFVSAPIVNWSTDDVWEFLFENNPPPWHYPHDEMLSLYRQANGGECPVVIDLNTPSCGGSRFGCWTCTVVRSDKSMQGFLQSPKNDWMIPLNEFRNWLKHIREDPSWRLPHRRNKTVGLGPFTPAARKLILTKLLEVEQATGKMLIRDDELQYIQLQWSNEFDFQNSALSLAKQYERCVGQEEEFSDMKLSSDEISMLADIAAAHEVDETLVVQLLGLEDEFPDVYAWGARANLKRRIARMLDLAGSQAKTATVDLDS